MFYLVNAILQPFVLACHGAAGKIIKIQMSFPVLDMVVKPPRNRLDIVIPWVLRLVAVAVVTGFFKNTLCQYQSPEFPLTGFLQGERIG